MNRVLLIATDAALSRSIAEGLASRNCASECAAGDADALRRLRRQSFDVVVTSPDTSVEEDLALLEEMRGIRPGIPTVILAPEATPEDVIAALRARVFACFSAPFDAAEIAELASRAKGEADGRGDIEVLCAHRNWVSLRVNCRLLTAERLLRFLSELRSDVPDANRERLMMAVREILVNAMEHGAGFDPDQVIEVAAVRTARAIVFHVRDPGEGFRTDSIPHAAVSNPSEDPTAHLELRSQQGLRPGGYGLLIAQGIVDELIYSEVGNEVLLIKHAV